MPQVFLPYMELLHKCIPASLREIRSAGFDGVECHLVGGLRLAERVEKVREEADKLDLGLRFHQGWSWETGQHNLYNVALRPLGALVPVGMPVAEQVLNAGNDPVVVYGNLVDEFRQQNFVYQTASEHVRGRIYSMVFDRFVDVVVDRSLPVVFDAQHVLEWFLNCENVTDLPAESDVIGQMTNILWQELGPFAEEIHLCDFDPRLGSSRGRNVFPGDGVFPLAGFCGIVCAAGWDGIVTPEVASQHLHGKLGLLREKVDQLFRQ